MASLIDDSVGRGYGVGVAGDGGVGLLAVLAATGALGGRRDEGCIPAQLNTVADGINHNINNAGVGINHNINSALLGITTQLNNGFGAQRDLDVMQKLGNIEGAIWQAEGQVQLAVGASQAAIADRIAQSTLNLTQGQNAINKNIFDASSANLVGQASIKESIAAYGAATLAAIKDSQYANTTATRDEADKVKAKIDFYHDQDMQRKLTVADTIIAERNAALRGKETEINISNTNTAVAAQAQSQTMQQQQFQILATLAAEVRNLANDVQVVRQAQSNVNFGVQTGTAQTASAANNKVG